MSGKKTGEFFLTLTPNADALQTRERAFLPTGLKDLLTHSPNHAILMQWKLKHESGLLPMGFVQYLSLCCFK